MIKLCFAGKMRSGKDTAAEIISTVSVTEVIKLAQPLYDIMYFAQDRAGIPRHKDRKFLQWLGTEWGRSISLSIWVNVLGQDLLKILEKYKNETHISAIPETYICTDARFDNELELLKEQGFKLVLVTAEESVRIERGADVELFNHESENGITKLELFDQIIENNGTKEEFELKVKSIYKEFKNETN